MTARTPALNRLCARLGILWRYRDGAGRRTVAPVETRRALCAVLGAPAETERQAKDALAALPKPPAWRIAAPGARLEAPEWSLTLEDGSRVSGHGACPPLPQGIHLWQEDGRETHLLIAPPLSPQPPGRLWGVTAPLYGLRTARGGSIGDLEDLARVAESAAALGADFIGLNPVHALFPTDPWRDSPYSPASRRYLNWLHAPLDDGMRTTDEVDYTAAWRARAAVMEEAFDADDAGFAAWRAGQGMALERFALHQALSERYGPSWPDWPAPYRDARSPECASFAQENAGRVTFHAWAQWRADQGLAAAQQRARTAGMRLGLYLDLAVGVARDSAEVWADPGLFATGASAGAPPDALGPNGQRWELAPFRPDVLAARGFAPIAETLRAVMRHAGAVRIDHIIGYQRAFWLPDGLPGAYVAQPLDALLAVARIEAARAGCVVIGEDLGAVPAGLRDTMNEAGLLGYRVAMFEQNWSRGTFRRPKAYPERALASFSTHDLPTMRGWWRGHEITTREEMGDIPPAMAQDARAIRASERIALLKALRAERLAPPGVSPDDPPDDVDEALAAALHAFFARAPSLLAAVQIEDLLGRLEQANLPGTVTGHPNWRRRLPDAALRDHPRAARIAAAMRGTGRGEDA